MGETISLDRRESIPPLGISLLWIYNAYYCIAASI